MKLADISIHIIFSGHVYLYRITGYLMSKFMVLYYASEDAMERMRNMAPEEGANMKRKWYEWKEKCGDSVIELGAPLMNPHTLIKEGSSSCLSQLGSYSVLETDSMETALYLLEDHPHLSFGEGCSLEVYESMPTPEL